MSLEQMRAWKVLMYTVTGIGFLDHRLWRAPTDRIDGANQVIQYTGKHKTRAFLNKVSQTPPALQVPER